jgi:hypothetical protein
MNLSFRFFVALLVLIFFPFAKLARAGDLTSAIIQVGIPLTPPITIVAGQSLKIRNFTQDGGTTPGSVSIMTPTSLITVLTAAIQSTTTSQLQVINEIVIAGPATVIVTAGKDTTGTGGTCFITYRKIPSN